MLLRTRTKPTLALVSVLVAMLATVLSVLPGSAWADDVDDEWAFVQMINQSRAEAGLGPVQAYGPIRDIARAQSIRMGQQARLYHNPNLRAEVEAAVPDWQRAGENVGQGWDVEGLHRAFMNSSGHRANVLGDYNYVGVGVVHANGNTWVTEVFLKAPGGKPTLQAVSPAPPPPPVPVDRIAGPGAADTALAVARRFSSGSANAVVVGRNDVFADALAGGPLAAVNGGPVLLTGRDTVSSEIVGEARRVLKPGGTVFLLGGAGALSSGVEASFRNAGLTVERLYGNDRYETAIAVARRVKSGPTNVFVVSGTNFADAMVAGPVAGDLTAPIVLAAPEGLTLGTRAYLLGVPGAERTVIGGVSAVSDAAYSQAGATERVAGADRYETAVKVASRFMPAVSQLSFATGTSFQDALAGAAWSSARDMPLILLSSAPHAATRSYVKAASESIDAATVYGATSTLPDSVVASAFV